MIRALLIAGFIALVYSQIGPGVPDSRCPTGTPNPPLHLNHPSNCSRFFTCSNSLAVPFECPPGQHWSISGNFCDWPDRARCEEGPERPGPGICPPGNPTPPVHFPHERYCNRFYKCSWGVPIEVRCPSGQHWSVEHGWCDWPDRANCNLRGSSKESNSSEKNSRERNSRERNSRERNSRERNSRERNSRERDRWW